MMAASVGGIPTEEEMNNFQWSNKMVKTEIRISGEGRNTNNREKDDGSMEEERSEERQKTTFKEAFLGRGQDENMAESIDEEDGIVSDDDHINDDEDRAWFSIGMTRAENMEV